MNGVVLRRPGSHSGAKRFERARGIMPHGVPWTSSAVGRPVVASQYPLADPSVSSALRARADEIESAFAAIEPTLRDLATRQFADGFADQARAELSSRLGLDVPVEFLAADWATPLDVRRLYARCVLGTFRRLIERAFDRGLADLSDGESAEILIQRWGFHAIDISPCADGRLSGVVDYILRVPPSVVVSRRSYAGAMFDVAETLRQWETVELRRFREGIPNVADAPTRFLKIGVYHFSSADPRHGGCAAHGSDDRRAAAAVLERLEQFAAAVRQTHCCDAEAAILLVGVDTDTDAIRVHVPDARGRMTVERAVDNGTLYEQTRGLTRDAAKEAIRDAVAACAGVALDDAQTEGMRWFCGYLLKNNLAQVDAVRAWHGGAYADRGHTERLIVVGDAVDDVQLRNLAFQAQMSTLEEGAADLDVGVRILRELHEPRGLGVPVFIHAVYDPRIPGARDVAEIRARRLGSAIRSRYADLAQTGALELLAVVRANDGTTLALAEQMGAIA
jgi:carboxysome shell carbonic anhydrase